MDEQSKKGKKFGLAFNLIAWILGFLLLMQFFAGFENKKSNPNIAPESKRQNGAIEVILKADRQGHFVANGYINNHQVTFLLDTGASGVAISEKLAHKLNLKMHYPLKLHTANGVVNGWSTEIDSLQIGEIELRKVSASVSPNLGREVLLGMSALKQLEFTHKDGKLLLRQTF